MWQFKTFKTYQEIMANTLLKCILNDVVRTRVWNIIIFTTLLLNIYPLRWRSSICKVLQNPEIIWFDLVPCFSFLYMERNMMEGQLCKNCRGVTIVEWMGCLTTLYFDPDFWPENSPIALSKMISDFEIGIWGFQNTRVFEHRVTLDKVMTTTEL